ncbi:MAG TPA: MlaD family protein [Opitutaceae bacterium]|nr:MlaD family protein [Opitutaceae bacterium]
MKTKVSPSLVGSFVLGALALALIALFAVGGVHFFGKPERFTVFFDESVHGLDLGSPVKLRGVRVGRVVSLNVRYNSKTNLSVVAVTCELSRNVILTEKGDLLEVSDRAELQKLVDRGLRAKLDLLGLATGLLFVQLDFTDPAVYPVPASSPDSKYVVVPAVPSAIAEFQASISEILSNVRRIDFAGLATEVHTLLDETHKQVKGLDLAGLSAEWTKAGASVNTLVNSPEIKQTLTNLNSAIAQLDATLKRVDNQVDPTAKELAATLAEAQKSLRAFNEAAGAAQNFIASQSGLGDEAARALAQMADAAASVQRLADFLERNPNALLTGKKGPR